MSQRHGTATNQLNNIIQVLQLGRKTGVLYVGRDSNMKSEEGSITFVYGQITSAYIGQLAGQTALNILSAWGPCHFTFLPTQMERNTKPLPDQTSMGFSSTAEKEGQTSLPQSPSGSMPGQAAPQRLKAADEALSLLERASLSRMHRHLLLLLDGQRTIAELSRLMNRGEGEILRLLRDLAQLGITERL
ncbi:MAG TPA: DUF4388 domain-containing protein [Ktedonobacteraceae bacterium]|jgi:hypothetical protein|nr:DUF4388 domain-containing protein [Ktedonobacteraceae bacterium]